jgi:hypothetical protein
MTTNALHTAIQRSQAALDAQNALNVLWDGSPQTRILFTQASDLIDKLYEFGRSSDDDLASYQLERLPKLKAWLDGRR